MRTTDAGRDPGKSVGTAEAPQYGRAMDDEDGYFGDQVAATYDDPSDEMFRPDAVNGAADFLAGLAGGGRALELGVGTGRIALPLSERGVPVHGIDMSRAMVARMREKPGGDAESIGVTIGDFATTRVDGTFSVAYLVFNTIIEVVVPELRKLPAGQSVVPFHVSPTRWAFDSYDIATQAVSSNYVRVEHGRGEYRSIPFRYVWPAELDLMAQLAGLRLRERWEGWAREPFTSESGRHVSVWGKPAG